MRLLTPTQRKAAGLLARGFRPAFVASFLPVSRATLLRWRRRPDFAHLVTVLAQPVAGSGIPGWLVNLLQDAGEPLAYALADLSRHGDQKALAVTLQALHRCPLPLAPCPAPEGKTGTAIPASAAFPETGGCAGFAGLSPRPQSACPTTPPLDYSTTPSTGCPTPVVSDAEPTPGNTELTQNDTKMTLNDTEMRQN